MDEECEIPWGSDLFRVTVWDKSGTISDYDSYATSVELAISHDKEMVKILKVEKLDPRSKTIIETYYYE
jgi:hypothetical protein